MRASTALDGSREAAESLAGDEGKLHGNAGVLVVRLVCGDVIAYALAEPHVKQVLGCDPAGPRSGLRAHSIESVVVVNWTVPSFKLEGVIVMAYSPIFKSAAAEAEFFDAYDRAMKLWPVPYEQHDVLTDYGSTHVIVSGPVDAPPIVLLHCALMTSAIWSPIVGELSSEHRTYAVDVMGDVGRTVPTSPPTTEAEAADWLEQVFEALVLEEAAIVAWSFGGGMATNFAMRHPDRVERLALLAPFKPFAKQGSGFLFGFVPFLVRTRKMAKRFEAKMCFAGDFGEREHSELLYLRYRCARFMLKVVPPRTFTDLEFRLLTMPVLLLVGDHEYLYDGAAAVDRANRILPNGRAELVRDCNHAIVSDQTEIVRQRLLDFVSAQ